MASLVGWAPRGMKIIEYVRKLGTERRYGVIAACDHNGIIAGSVEVTRETIDNQVFTQWFITKLLPQCQRFPAPRSVVLIDGAGFHDVPTLVAAGEAVGVWVLTCPPMRPRENTRTPSSLCGTSCGSAS